MLRAPSRLRCRMLVVSAATGPSVIFRNRFLSVSSVLPSSKCLIERLDQETRSKPRQNSSSGLHTNLSRHGQHFMFFEDAAVVGVDFDEANAIAPQLRQMLERALGFGFVEDDAVADGVRDDKAARA